MTLIRLLPCLFLLLSSALLAATPALDTAGIEKGTGLSGKWNETEKVFKVSYPRKDLSVTSNGVRITPAMGLTAWAAFTPVSGGHAAVMGDIVMTESQVDSVLSAALSAGLEVTALHNHFFGEQPRIVFMHISGMAGQAELAARVGKVFEALRTSAVQRGSPATVSIDPATTKLDPGKIDAVLSHPGELKDGVYKIVIGRSAKMAGHAMGKEMGVNTWAAFAGRDEQAVVDGDFAMRENELQNVLKALRSAGISVVAIHNHMTGETPRTVFLHYWGIGPTTELARGLKAALDTLR
jgi:hypothetical protein